ncbi:aminoacyl-tRNA hydrolase [Facklamia sp. 7083-14-GEN3]|uniref:aminoacyl-tRNA hydrolase n=1 Tax=Facklamia sp. 7083-14-GEN3 TaxID=2973478 RepID=UPI00215C055E|nr:aminoacyl-tRNA hydrolase [Facklamia sp. 7083-14-GEN3]MCR8969667.1 aminoacyl-tRNA hydrolase [Facklamia sp. 7083-14-GEN3]
MKMIVGLGNPGERYANTRHNAGFEAIDRLVDKEGLSFTDQKFDADFTIWRNQTDKILLVKPFTYMNNSGQAVLPLMSYYGIAVEDLIVVYDDLDLEPGRIRLREKGSAGGHNGMKSIIHMLGTNDFKRIRIGIGRPQAGWKVIDHVLAPFDKDSLPLVTQAIDHVADALTDWVDGKPYSEVMNFYNRK